MNSTPRQAKTLKEVARQCGLAISTVSRVLSGSDLSAASEDVRRKIWRVAEESGYLELLQHRSRKMAANNYGLSLAFVFARDYAPDSGQFFAELFQGLERFCHERQYKLTGIFQAGDDLVMPDAQGLIILGFSNSLWVQRLKSHYRHVVYMGLAPLPGEPCDQVICDGRQAAREGVRHLARLGHRSIGYIGEITDEQRYRGYLDALEELELEPEFIYPTVLSASGGYEAGLKLAYAKRRPSAVFCANDITALGLFRAAREQHLDIPGQLSVISLDDIELARFSTPRLTTIHIPKDEIASLAVKVLADRIYSGHHLPLRLEVPFFLKERESCAPPRGQ